MYLAYKQHAHRYKGILRLKKSKSQIEAIGQMSSTLKPDAKAKVQANVKTIYGNLDNAIGKPYSYFLKYDIKIIILHSMEKKSPKVNIIDNIM